MTTLRGHFDGRVVIPEDPSKLRPGQDVTITGEPADPDFGTVGYIIRNLGEPISDEDARQMTEAIEEACERIDPEPDVSF
jgi:hypothetical protein